MIPYIIGICGRSCSGKSTLVTELKKQTCDILYINQDQFFRKPHPKYENWESPDVIMNDDLIVALKLLKRGYSAIIPSHAWTEVFDKEVYPKKYIIVEGYLLFVIDELCDLFDKRIWIDVSDKCLLNRRIARDRSGGKGNLDSIEYIKNVVIPESKVYESKQQLRSDIIIDGNQSIDHIVKEFRGRCLL